MDVGKRPALFLGRLRIAPPGSLPSSAADGARVGEPKEGREYDFSDVFGPDPSAPTPSSASPAGRLLVEVIHARSHSFVGPSPRPITSSSSSSFKDDADAVSSAAVPEVEEEEEEECIHYEAEEGEKEGERKKGPSDFEIISVVGRGAFGKVFLVRRRKGVLEEQKHSVESDEQAEVFAMKVMRKDTIIKKNQAEYMKAERDILTKITHPFIVHLRYSFQTKSKLYLILDFINGGHLFFHLYRQGIFSEDQARFYTAEIVSAVSHLHCNGIVHRDLKPENILMDADGHVLLTDFGLAKEIDESNRSNSMCGTTEYMAPEIILLKGHNKDADWWSIGILLFEMLTGQPPFTHKNRRMLQQRIVKEKVKLPPYLSSEVHSLLKGLLQKDPAKRLGSGSNGGDQVKMHRWFKQINWKKLEARELEPKFKPDVSGRDCTANFDQCWTSIAPEDSPAPTPTSEGNFLGYSYVAPRPSCI